jgi:hypothetical protein
MVTPEIELQVVTSGDEGEDETYEDAEGNGYDRDKVQFRQDGSAYALGEPYEPVVFEESVTDYVNWEDFGHSVARTWDEVSYVWRRVYLSREQLIDRFGENLGKLIPLDWGPVEQGGRDEAARMQKKAAVYEIWCKPEKKVYWISKSWSSRPLDERDDPLGLDGFFPCPRPLLATTGNDSVLPIPDYVYYQDQAEEIDKLTARIAELQDAVKVRGFYAAAQTTNLNNLLSAPNNWLIPVPEWLGLKENGGARGMVEWWPIDQVVAALNALIQQRQQLINDVYQITGVADILRGMNDPRATATAEQIKGQWGTLRIRDRQVEVQRFCRDVLRIKAEVIAEKFAADTLKAMSGLKLPTAAEKAQAQAIYAQGAQQYQLAVQQAQAAQQPPPPMPEVPPELQKALASPSWEEVEALLHDNAMRQFRIDIETDSTIEPNQQEEKARAVEFLTAMGQMIGQWGPAVEARPELAPMAGEFIKWGARFFRISKSVEDVIDSTMDKIVQAASAPKAGPQAPPPDQTKIAVESIKSQTAQMQEAAETQRAQIAAQVDMAGIEQKREAATAKLYALPRDPNPQVAL